MSMTRSDILENARRCVVGDREQDYGSPESNFARIASFWSAYLGAEIYPKDVAAMLALLKIARIASGHAKADNWIDLAGYAACGGEIEGGELPKAEKSAAEEQLEEILELPNCIDCAHSGACEHEPSGADDWLRFNCPLWAPDEEAKHEQT